MSGCRSISDQSRACSQISVLVLCSTVLILRSGQLNWSLFPSKGIHWWVSSLVPSRALPVLLTRYWRLYTSARQCTMAGLTAIRPHRYPHNKGLYASVLAPLGWWHTALMATLEVPIMGIVRSSLCREQPARVAVITTRNAMTNSAIHTLKPQAGRVWYCFNWPSGPTTLMRTKYRPLETS